MPQRIESFFDPDTSTWSHVLWCVTAARAAVIDPVLDYDASAGRTGTGSADRIIEFIRDNGLTLDWIIETHAHADHLTAAQHVKKKLGGQVAIGAGIRSVQRHFRSFFNLGDDFPVDGSQFDQLLEAGEPLQLGRLDIEILATPGHTDDSISLLAGDAAFIGDTMFSPSYGTARCDFPGGDAASLYRSVRRLLALPDETQLYLCHDYPIGGERPRAAVSVAEQRRDNVHVRDGIPERQFVEMRSERDAGLEAPRLLLPSVQFNIGAGRPPAAETNGISYFKIPLNQL